MQSNCEFDLSLASDFSGSFERFNVCPCCGCKVFRVIWKNPSPKSVGDWREFKFGSRKFIDSIKGCNACGFRYLETIIGGADFYRNADGEEYHTLTDARLRYFREVKANFQRRGIYLPTTSRMLDLGAGEGDWLAAWPEIAERFATEMQPDFIQYMQKTGISVLPTLESVTEKFDMISAFDFLEHVEDPNPLLQKIHGKLSEGGIVIIGVPDMGKWLARLFGTRYYLYCPMHYSYFTRKSLNKLLSQHFSQVEIFPSPPMRATLEAVAKWVFPKFDHPVLGRIWLPLGYSASLIAFARKSS